MNKASILKDIEYNEHKPVIKVLFETPFTKEIRIAMQKGVLMKEHKTPYPIVVELVDGSINFGVNGEICELSKGDLLSLEGNVPHNLSASENSIIRLTLTKNDQAKRVEKVIND